MGPVEPSALRSYQNQKHELPEFDESDRHPSPSSDDTGRNVSKQSSGRGTLKFQGDAARWLSSISVCNDMDHNVLEPSAEAKTLTCLNDFLNDQLDSSALRLASASSILHKQMHPDWTTELFPSGVITVLCIVISVWLLNQYRHRKMRQSRK